MKKLLKLGFIQLALALLIRLYVSLLFLTCKVHIKAPDETIDIFRSKAFLFLCWHGRILPFAHAINRITGHCKSFKALVSRHADTAILVKFLAFYGHRCIFGSANKGFISAMHSIVKAVKEGTGVGITPDGPKGPIFNINGNIAKLAQRFNLPIILACYSCSKCWVVNSWDKFMIPKLFSNIYIEFKAPLYNLTNEDIKAIMVSHIKTMDNYTKLKIDYGVSDI